MNQPAADLRNTPLTLAEDPFTPGMGIAPPHLAGREAEQNALLAGLQRLRAGKPMVGLIVSAPRGLGKTVLLDWLVESAEPTEATSHNLNANQIPSVAALAEALFPPETSDAGFSLGVRGEVAGTSAGFDLARTPPPPRAPAAYERLIASGLQKAAKKSPQIVLVDEAQTLAPEVLRALCNQSQAVARRKLPCWLILAGTPGLMTFLMSEKVGSSFVERADEMHPELLSDEAAEEALLKPLAMRGWTLPAAGASALDQVVDDAQGYPYFIQLWGRALWTSAVARGEKIWDDALVAAASGQVDEKRLRFYDGRHRELTARVGPLDGRQVRAAAEHVAEALLTAGPNGMSGPALESTLPLASDACAALIERFEKVGFIVRHRGRWQPGIPSFAQHLLEQAQL